MIGAPEVDVTGITRDGSIHPLLRDGRWLEIPRLRANSQASQTLAGRAGARATAEKRRSLAAKLA